MDLTNEDTAANPASTSASSVSPAADPAAPARVIFDTKIAVILRDDLPVWKKLNVTAFIVSGIAATVEGVVGPRYVDGSGKSYLPMFRQPVLVYAAGDEELRRAFNRVSERELDMSIFTEDLFDTGHDDDNRAAVAAVPTDELRLVGIAVRGEKGRVDKALKGLRLHR
ncbi:DUF2000 domain-containing protein [Paraburkholderia kururiensis]|uniref:DUF2000 domain-containing protein n=1 Tax=Paraburkholderia kururiensis TaxID=984307 RepID=UPI0018F6F16D|nr:DUF2000 domain-containing protein [Paraburkholderia kururiensis]